MATLNKAVHPQDASNGLSTTSASATKGDNSLTMFEKYTSCRWRLSYMLTLSFTLVMIQRNCLSFAIVCMTGEATQIRGDNFNGSVMHNESRNKSDMEQVFDGEFSYSSETQGFLISSVYYAAIISPIIGSLASRRFGPKRVLTFAVATGGAVMLVTPVAARTHIYLFVACRVLTGFAVTVAVPVSLDFWPYWAPKEEKAQLIAYAFSGFTVATIITFALSGLICSIPIDNGWPFIFYIFGGCAFLWCVLWCLTVHESPESHPGISEKEKSYIISTRSKQASDSEKTKIPWKSIMTSRGVWAYIITLISHTWTAMVLLSYLPLYMATVLKFDVKQNGVLSAMPFVSRGLGTLFWGYIGTKIVKHTSVTNTRKLVQGIGYVVSSGLSIALCYVGEGQEYVAVAIFIIAALFQAVIFNAAIVTPAEMAPQFASLISSFGTFFNMIVMIISPMAVSYMINNRSREQWAVVFYINAGIYVFGTIIFAVFGSGDLQPWAENSSQKDSGQHNVRKKGHLNPSFVTDMEEVTHM